MVAAANKPSLVRPCRRPPPTHSSRMSTNLAATRAAPGCCTRIHSAAAATCNPLLPFFLFKNKTSKNTHTLTQNVKQKHCLVVRKSSSQEEATTLGEVSPGKLRGRSHSRQIPHSSSSSSSKRVLLPLFISKKENLSRSPVVLARFLAKPFKPIVRNSHTHERSHTRKQHWKTTPECVRPEPEPEAPDEEPVLRSCVCVKKTQFG